jgi:vacuolar-type H+-ATPase catalytic subunit A/Vma1
MININCLKFLGILGSIFDGIQRPLKVSIETVTVTGHQSSFSTKEVWQKTW